MRYRLSFALGAAAALLAACGQIGGPKHAGEPTEQARSMQQMLADINQIRAYTYGSGDLATAQAAGDNLATWSGRMSELFPPGRTSADYVDMSPDRVANAPSAMLRTALALQDALRRGDRGVVGQRLAQTEKDGCGFCHRSH